MTVVRTHAPDVDVAARSTFARRRPGRDEPLLHLQRAAGNQAVATLVQRKAGRYRGSSKVAVATMETLYEGKCDAVPKGAQVRYKWSRGLLGKDVSIIFECGPKSFEFSAFHPYIGDRFPWDVEGVDGGPAWVGPEVSTALDDIEADIDDAGPRFWRGYHEILDRLSADLQAYCSD